jgi:hypothetical protein
LLKKTAVRIPLLAALTLLGALSVLTCKEGSDLTGATVTVTPEFVPTPVTPGVTDHYVTLEKGAASGNRLTLDVVVHSVSEPVSGIALKLKYPNTFAKFTKCTDGDLLPPAKCYFAEPSSGSGEVFIGRTITAPQQPVSVPTSKVIVRVEFLVFGMGAGAITIEGQNLGGGDASALLDAAGDPILVQWFAGSLAGT